MAGFGLLVAGGLGMAIFWWQVVLIGREETGRSTRHFLWSPNWVRFASKSERARRPLLLYIVSVLCLYVGLAWS